MDNKMILIDKDGKEQKCDVVALFNNPKINAEYVAYTDGTTTDGKLNLLVSRCSFKGEKLQLEEIVDEKEWQFIDNHLKTYVFGDDDFE